MAMGCCLNTHLIEAFHFYLDPLHALVQLEIHLLFGLVRVMTFSELQPTGGMVSICAGTFGSIFVQQRLHFQHSDASPCCGARLTCDKEDRENKQTAGQDRGSRPSSKYWGPHCITPPDVVMQCWSAALAPAQRDLQTTSHHTGLSRCSSCCAAQQRPSRWPPHSGQSGGAPQAAAAGGGPLCGCRWQPRWGSETGWAAGAGRRCTAGTGI